MKVKEYFLQTVAVIALLPLVVQTSSAQEVIGTGANNQNLLLIMNNDGTLGEGLILQDDDGNDGVYRDFARILNNGVSFSGSITDIDDDTVDIGENLNVSGNISTSNDILIGGVIRDPNVGGTVQIADPLLVSGATGGEISLNVVGQTTLDDTTIAGVTSISGATSINTTGAQTTTIGNANATTSIFGTASITGSTTVTGATSINTSGAANTTIGNANTSTAIFGNASITGTTLINTTGSAATTVGNSSAASAVTMAGGTSRVALGNGQTNINTTSGAANTSIGVAGNTTSVQSTSIAIGNDTQSSMIMVGTGSAFNSIAMGNDEIGTVISATAGNTSQVMMNNVIANTVEAGEGVAGGTVVGTNGASRFVADANGKLTEVTNADTTSGTTASIVVQNSAGNIHGLVVQEAKTTLSGGINSASLTLDDRGATFSDPANGNPIQVHGVADGTAPFDAVNVRQLYSGLASVLAAAPDIRLEPGKTGFGIGVGSYGGYQAVGLGFGHMYDNGVVLTGSVARGAHSETAARASLSWTW